MSVTESRVADAYCAAAFSTNVGLLVQPSTNVTSLASVWSNYCQSEQAQESFAITNMLFLASISSNYYQVLKLFGSPGWNAI